jgi:uncharacterized protein with HEPN domain
MKKNNVAILRNVKECAEKIEAYIGSATEEQFASDNKTVDAVLMQILTIGEYAGRLQNIDLLSRHSEIPWDKIKGLRNIIAHSYDKVDRSKIWNTVQIIRSEFSVQLQRAIECETKRQANDHDFSETEGESIKL